MRTLILVISRNAVDDIAPVLRFYRDQAATLDTVEWLFVDDASTDGTREAIQRAVKDAPLAARTRNVSHQHPYGLGGNQKMGFRYAIERSFDAVIVLPVEGPVDPQAVTVLLKALHSDAEGAAWFVAHPNRRSRVSDRLRSAIAKVSTTGWDGLGKAYRVDWLKRVPFELDAPNAAFDTELLLQLTHIEAPLRVIQDPALSRWRRSLPWGDFWESLKACLKYRLQRYELFYDIRFHPEATDAAPREVTQYAPKFDAASPHQAVLGDLQLVPAGSKVLDIGCASGYLAEALVRQRQCEVVGVDCLPAATAAGKPYVYHCLNLDQDGEALQRIVQEGDFDVIMMLDVLEHLALPELFLLRLYRARYRKPVRFIASTGNVAFLTVRLMLFLGQFNYGQRGILDITHKRLFTLRTFRNLFAQTGFKVLRRQGFPLPYLKLGLGKTPATVFEAIHRALIRVSMPLFAYQILFVAVPLATPEQMLDDAADPEHGERALHDAKR